MGLFNAIHDFVALFIWWKWYDSASSKISIKRKLKFPSHLGAKTKLYTEDELVTTLIKMQLVLAEQYVADRFKASLPMVSLYYLQSSFQGFFLTNCNIMSDISHIILNIFIYEEKCMSYR